ncbi:hypothetical protein [Blastococcus deserti]|uniref:Uncharacterized protein n=1 Tax=Blastococcus deserti TaxID=2259033 RepID=A0ABW4X994_9ACTN
MSAPNARGDGGPSSEPQRPTGSWPHPAPGSEAPAGTWSPPQAPAWAPAWEPPPTSGWRAPGAPTAAPAGPARSRGPLGLALVAGVGLLAGAVGAALLVTAAFLAGAEDIGRQMADQVGPAVERGIADGSEEAMQAAMDQLMGAVPEDLALPGEPVDPAEQFPPTPPEDLGSDPALDQYAQQCFDGALQACDDLYYESPPMSEYETYANTCGGRVKEYTVGSCTELE